MNLYEILLYILIAFSIFNTFLRVYPVNFTRSKMTKTVHLIQGIVLECSLIFLLLLIIFRGSILKMQIFMTIYSNRLSFLIIFLVVSVIFAITLLLPCSWRLIKINQCDFNILNSTQDTIIDIVFNSGKIDNLENLKGKHKEIFDDYGISKAIDLFIERYKQMNNCPKDIGDFLLKRCFEVIQINNMFKPNPFEYFNIILSFGTSTVLAFIISILTLNIK